VSNKCVLTAGTARVERLLGPQHPQFSTKRLRLIAAFDSEVTASGSFDEFQNLNISLIQVMNKILIIYFYVMTFLILIKFVFTINVSQLIIISF
jgi:hypothetical protein